MTLVWKNLSHSLSGVSKKSCGPKTPTLLTTMSKSGCSANSRAGGFAAEIARESGYRRLLAAQPRQGRIDAGIATAVDDDVGASRQEAFGSSEADAAGGPGDEHSPAGEVDLHVLISFFSGPAWPQTMCDSSVNVPHIAVFPPLRGGEEVRESSLHRTVIPPCQQTRQCLAGHPTSRPRQPRPSR